MHRYNIFIEREALKQQKTVGGIVNFADSGTNVGTRFISALTPQRYRRR